MKELLQRQRDVNKEHPVTEPVPTPHHHDFLLSVPSTDSLVAEPEVSTRLIPKPATGHDPEPVSTTSHLQILLRLHICIYIYMFIIYLNPY
jgi:hypothetical protein